MRRLLCIVVATCLAIGSGIACSGQEGGVGPEGASAVQPREGPVGAAPSPWADCTPTTCAAQGTDCGTISDGCDGTLDCGTCSGLFTCGGGGIPNRCGCHMVCNFVTCADVGAVCGTIDDGCGGTFDCGSCAPPATCGGSGSPNVCGCTPATCASAGAACGTISDGCGGTLDCGPCPGCPESLSSNFNGTAIAAGDTIWFSSVGKVQGGTGDVTLHLTNGSIVVSGQGVSQTILVPDATITITSSVSTATLSFNGSWSEVVPPHTAGNIFLAGAEFTLPQSWPGGIHSVTWTADFSASQSGVSVSWQWAAAVYTKFGTLDSLGVKPCDDNHASAYQSSDHAGTPESFKEYVTGGARGGGGANFTGSYSGTLSFPVCPD